MINEKETKVDLRTRTDKPSKIVYAMDGNTQLSEPCLRCMLETVNPNDMTSVVECLNFLEVYSLKFVLPIRVAILIQDMLMSLLKLGPSPEIADSILAIISRISRSYSSKYNFEELVSIIWSFLPRPNAFDAISALIYSNEEVLPIVTREPYLDSMMNFFACDDFIVKSGALSIIKSLSAYADYPSLFRIFDMICNFHFESSGSLRVQSFELLNSLVQSENWRKSLCNDERFASVFRIQTDDYANYSAQLISGLRLLQTILYDCEDDIIGILSKSQTFDSIVVSLKHESEVCRKVGIEICFFILVHKCFVEEISSSEIPFIIMQWKDGCSFELWKTGFSVLCLLFLYGSSSFCGSLLSHSFAEIVALNFSTVLFDASKSSICLATIAKLISVLKSTNEDVSDLSKGTDLVEALCEFIETAECDDLRCLATLVCEELQNS